MNNLPGDPNLREYYEAFAADHDQHRETLMTMISTVPSQPAALRAEKRPRRWQQLNRRVLVGLAAMLVVGLSLPFVSIGFESKPATVLPEGWRREFAIDNDQPSVTKNEKKPSLDIWTDEGWLIVCRKSPEGEVEWQVVLAEKTVAEEPKVTQTPDHLTVTFGSYSIHDASSGDLKIRRQPKKSRDQWPVLDLEKGHQMASSSNWRGNSITGRKIGDWIWAASGQSDLNNGIRSDVWLRLDHNKQGKVSYGGSGGILSMQFFFGTHKATDDGRQFTANRFMTANLTQNPRKL